MHEPRPTPDKPGPDAIAERLLFEERDSEPVDLSRQPKAVLLAYIKQQRSYLRRLLAISTERGVEAQTDAAALAGEIQPLREAVRHAIGLSNEVQARHERAVMARDDERDARHRRLAAEALLAEQVTLTPTQPSDFAMTYRQEPQGMWNKAESAVDAALRRVREREEKTR